MYKALESQQSSVTYEQTSFNKLTVSNYTTCQIPSAQLRQTGTWNTEWKEQKTKKSQHTLEAVQGDWARGLDS